MAISSNTLFQFTSSRGTLEKILQSQYLWPQYCTEYFWDSYRFALPMTCLCDIPLSEAKEHINRYGKYGIGISKDWVKEIKELSTVIYTRRDTYLYKKVVDILKRRSKGEFLSSEEIFILSRVKKYSGSTYCQPNGKRVLEKVVRFYDEREWRYVPVDLSTDDIMVEKNQDIKAIIGNNDKYKGKPQFEYSDLKYLIVRDDNEREKLINYIDEELKTKIKKKERTLLKSKILTVKQIAEDF